MSTSYIYVPGQKQCPKCGGGVADPGHLTAVGAMPARPFQTLSLTCADVGCGTYNGASPIGTSNATAEDVAAWGDF
jgi:hypothetical protein